MESATTEADKLKTELKKQKQKTKSLYLKLKLPERVHSDGHNTNDMAESSAASSRFLPFFLSEKLRVFIPPPVAI